ncbi:MAG: guanylate cyclase [Eggerthellaceae bacterium]|nr:guanylate cyclase [Eggerthellaceae bacterium]
MFVRLYRIVPLLALLAVIAGVVYVVMSFRYSSDKAKATLIQVFTWLTAILSVVFLIGTLYALLEGNEVVVELAASFMATTLVGLGITRICNRVFQKNHPDYGEEVATATVVNPTLSSKFGEAFKKAFGEALKETFTRGGKR